jgi:apolipoprotein N-acyltransferase
VKSILWQPKRHVIQHLHRLVAAAAACLICLLANSQPSTAWCRAVLSCACYTIRLWSCHTSCQNSALPHSCCRCTFFFWMLLMLSYVIISSCWLQHEHRRCKAHPRWWPVSHLGSWAGDALRLTALATRSPGERMDGRMLFLAITFTGLQGSSRGQQEAASLSSSMP